MSEPIISMHSNLNQLLAAKVPILSGRGSSNSFAIVEQIALNGPLLKYDIFKNLGKARYSTISRRVDDLMEREYLGIARKRLTQRGKHVEESMYGLRWKGFIASLSSEKVRENIVDVLRNNPLLILPEKEPILLVIEEITTKEELENISQAIFEAYLDVVPNIELIIEDQLWVYFLAIRNFSHFPQFKLSRMPENMLELMDRPPILKIIKEKVAPFIQQQADQFAFLSMVFKRLNEITNLISNLDTKVTPSIEVKKYLETLQKSNAL
ncbi:MAG: hypothetical protein ABSA75_11485 [Candidatus Bathyarchaeia archaeon]